MKKILLIISYDGTGYHGYQVQGNLNTVEKRLDEAVSDLLGKETRVVGASRTDAKVHAYGAAAAFESGLMMPADRYKYALNARLPGDIVVRESLEVPMDFHPRYDSLGKVYEYRILNTKLPDPMLRNYAHFLYEDLDVAAMDEAAGYFEGRHDFVGFATKKKEVTDTVRTLSSCKVITEGDIITIRVEGEGFLYNMVRIIVGTLIRVGEGKIPPKAIPGIIKSKDRSLAGPTAPPQGLYLMETRYEWD